MLKKNILAILLTITFVAVKSPAAISSPKESVLANLMSLSQDINVEELKAVGLSIDNEEMDVVLFRLQREIEKVPEYDLATKQEYDLRGIQALMEIVYAKASTDYLGAVDKIKNLAGKRLYGFPIFSELFIYQLDAVILRSKIYLTNDHIVSEELLGRLQLIESYIQQNKQFVLSSVDLSKASTIHSEHLAVSCVGLFS